MATYTVRDPTTGKTVKLTGDSPPTEQELEQVFKQLNAPADDGRHDWRLMQGSPESLKGMSDPITGALQGAANTFIGAGEKAYNYLPGVKPLVDAIYGGPQGAAYPAAKQQYATPQTLGQRVGFGMEQTGEFFALPKISGALPVRAAGEAMQAGTLTAAQGGDARQIALSALPGGAGALLPRAAHAAEGVASQLKESAKKNVVQAMNPTTARNKRLAEQVAPGLLERGTYTATKQGLRDKAASELEQLGGKFDAANAALPQGNRLATEPVRDAIQSEMLALLKQGSNGKNVPVNPQKYQALEELDNTLEQLGDKVSRETLQAFKEEWADAVARGGGFAEKAGDALTQAQLWAKRKGADAIRRELAKDSPDIDALNAEYAFWSKVEDVTDATLSREKPHKGAMRRVAGMVGAATGMAHGGVQGAAIGAGLGSQLMRVMDSPGWKLAAAHTKNKLADALASSDPERIGAALGRVIASMPAQYRPMQPVAAH
jgi:hypothetical protein